MTLISKDLHVRKNGFSGNFLRLAAGVKFEMLLLALLLLTAGAIIWQDQILEQTLVFTPANSVTRSRLVMSDKDNGGQSVVREIGPLAWACDLRNGNPYPYCGYELFFDGNKGTHGLNLTNMRALTVTMLYRGAATSFRIHLKNFDPRYSHSANDDTPKYLRVEADTTPGKLQSNSFIPADFGVADWWMRKYKLAPEYGRPQFDNVTSMVIETGSEAPLGAHAFNIREIRVRTAILSRADWYSLLLGIWIMMIVAYLGYRIGNLRRALKERQILEALALREAQEAASHDHLTKILNRRGMTERFEALGQRKAGAFTATVIMIDIDHFKRLNDTYGHDTGDQVLSDIAGVISANVRSVDLVARWGGEEFMVICSDIDRRGAQQVAEKIRSRIAAFDFGACGSITASLGLHWSQGPEPELAQLVTLADTALYIAKANGRNCCRLHRAAMSKVA